jgi:site-specific recombinase XerD
MLFDFIRDCELGKTLQKRAKKKLSLLRMVRLMNYLRNIGFWLNKDFDKVTIKDMEDFILKYENNTITQPNGNPYTHETKLSYKMALKKFYKWLYGTGEKLNKLVGWIETFQCLKEISALTRQEVEKLVMMAGDIRYKTVILCLFDSGARAEEFFNIRLKHLSRQDEYYMMRITYSKTKPRTISLPMCTELIDEYLKQHPDKDNPDAIFATVSYDSLRVFLTRYGQKILKKNVTPHLLRHSSASYYCNKLTQYQLCYRYGWSMASEMPARYIDRQGIFEKETAKLVKQDDMFDLKQENKHLKEDFIRLREQMDRINELMTPLVRDRKFVGAIVGGMK